jgi:hypothetical protein
MGMTFVSWFQECCSSCWILHDANVVVSLSRRDVLEWRGRSVVGFVCAWLLWWVCLWGAMRDVVGTGGASVGEVDGAEPRQGAVGR